jgi:phage FluMu gp28-like protein
MSALSKWYGDDYQEPLTPDQVDTFFLGYQKNWLQDDSRLKIWEKSRRIGATFCQAYEDVIDASTDDGMDVWFTSADESAAKEYIRYCAFFARILNIAANDLGEQVIDNEKDIKALVIELSTGRRIHGLSSNPTAFRSKGGKLVIDEFAFHKDPDALWKAAAPVVTWGYPVRILSTYNGTGNRYYRMVEDAKKGNKWSLHTTTIVRAVQDGLVSKMLGRPANDDEKATFLQECRDIAGDDETFNQEYMCIPVDEATAWLTWTLIGQNEHKDAGKSELYAGGDCYVGMDIGRHRDLTVIWILERVGDVLWTREIVSMKKAKFASQLKELARVMDQYRVRRVCMDETGMGMKMVEDAKDAHGDLIVEGVTFTSVTKQHLASIIKENFEDKVCRIPVDQAIRNSHHAVRKMTTAAGNPRFDADRTEVGHADEFWAHALAQHAAEDPGVKPAGSTLPPSNDNERPGRSRPSIHPQPEQRGIFRSAA